MNLYNGASKRPKLSLPFGGRPASARGHAEYGPAIIPAHELRRIVAAMVD